jgi:hypothetical protein
MTNVLLVLDSRDDAVDKFELPGILGEIPYNNFSIRTAGGLYMTVKSQHSWTQSAEQQTRIAPDGSQVTLRTTSLWPCRTDMLIVSSRSISFTVASLTRSMKNHATTSKKITHSDETAIRFPAGSTAMQRMHAAAELVTTASISGSPALYCRTSESLLPENHASCCLYG